MPNPRHVSQAPDVERLLNILHLYEIRYVLVGSVPSKLYGVDLQPGDLDIVPALEQTNLERLIAVLQAVEATPEASGGHWARKPDGELGWVDGGLSAAEQAARVAAWQPLADDLTTLDHLFYTRLGNFDVVPEIAGRYVDLQPRASMVQVAGVELQLAHIDDLLASITVPRRPKDAARVAALRKLQRGQ